MEISEVNVFVRRHKVTVITHKWRKQSQRNSTVGTRGHSGGSKQSDVTEETSEGRDA